MTTDNRTFDEGWIAGVRWAAAEADAVALREPEASVLYTTDHLRLCAVDPGRETAISRTEAPERFWRDVYFGEVEAATNAPEEEAP